MSDTGFQVRGLSHQKYLKTNHTDNFFNVRANIAMSVLAPKVEQSRYFDPKVQ